jgi:carbon-monoxide dehydrogenase small subunit
MKIELTINGEAAAVDVAPSETLLEMLRRIGYTSAKDGCAHGDCGTCAVLIDGRAATACLLFAAQADGREITTIEGLAGDGHGLAEAMLDVGAVQCGFCIPAMILTAADLLRREAKPSRQEIATYLAGNLCRCTGYVKQLDAVELAIARAEEVTGG